jgi:hypothetical protein
LLEETSQALVAKNKKTPYVITTYGVFERPGWWWNQGFSSPHNLFVSFKHQRMPRTSKESLPLPAKIRLRKMLLNNVCIGVSFKDF